MVGVTRLFNTSDDKEKLTKLDLDAAEKAYVEDTLVYQRPEVIITRQAIRTRLCIRVLCLLTCFLFGCFLLVGGVLLYRFFSTPKVWYGDCNVKYRPAESGYLIDHGGLYADDFVDSDPTYENGPVFRPKELDSDGLNNPIIQNLIDDNDDSDVDDANEKGEFKQDLQLNMTGQVEQITVPNFADFRYATFIHDFTYNWSVIVDVNTNRCFIMELDRTKVSPPKSIYDILQKAMNGYYLPENILLHQNLQVQMPALDDLTPYGENIEQKCMKKESYFVKKQHLLGSNHEIDKRDAVEKRCEFPFNFINSVGTFTLAYHLKC